MTRRNAQFALVATIAVAVAFNLWVAVREWSDLTTGGWWFIWSLFPFAAAIIVAIISRRPMLGAVTSAVALMLSVASVVAIRSSSSSTAAIGYLWFPLWNLLVVLIMGTVCGLVWARLSRRNGAN